MLEAFGNAKSVHNNNSTRFIMNLDLFFEPFGGVVGAKLNTCESDLRLFKLDFIVNF